MFCQGSVNIFKNSKRDEKKLTSLCREDASWEFGGLAFTNSCASCFTGLRTDSGLPRPCHIWISYEETCTFKRALQFVLMLWTKHIQKYHYMTLKWLLINIHLEPKSIHWTGWHPAVSIFGRCVYSQCPLELVPSRFNFTFRVGTVFIVVYQLPMHSVHLKARAQGWDSYLRLYIHGPSNTEFGLKVSYCSEALFCSIATLQVGRT